MKKIVFVLIFLSFLSVSAQNSETDSTISFSSFIDGKLKLKFLNDFEGAIIDITNAIRIGESNNNVFVNDVSAKTILQEYYLNRAIAYSKLAKYDYAIKDYTSFMDLKNTYSNIDAEDFFKRGACYLMINDNEAALSDYNSGLNIEENITNIGIRGMIYFSLLQYKKAIDDFSIMIDHGINKYLPFRGESYFMINNYHSAINDFSIHLENNLDAEIFFLKACSYALLNSSSLACANFKESCSLGYSKACDLVKEVDGVCFEKIIKRPTRTESNTVSLPSNSKIQLPIILEGNMKYIIVKVGNKQYKYLIDTGASDMIINSEMESYLLANGFLKNSYYDEPRIYEIANGQRIELKIAKLPFIEIGNYKFSDINIAIGNEKASLLLGMSFLNRFDWKFTNNHLEIIQK